MNETQDENSDFSIQFVNTKSKERVLKLVSEMKECFKPVETKTELIASKVLEELDKEPQNYLRHPILDNIKQNPEEQPISKASTAPLRPFLFPTYPSTVPKDYAELSDRDYARARRNFLIECREEHQRLLYTFQDRLTRELCTADDHFLSSSFQDAMQNISKDQDIPAAATEKRKEALQSRFNSLMRRSQKQTLQVLEFQKRCAKLLQDQEKFVATHKPKSEKVGEEKPAAKETPEPGPINITFPFSFLSDGGYTK